MFLFKRKSKPAVEDETVPEEVEAAEEVAADIAELAEEPEPVRRVKQQNIKASEDCIIAFAAIAKALGRTKAELFEDMVVERLEALQRQGVSVDLA
jgi:hypothetical protein